MNVKSTLLVILLVGVIAISGVPKMKGAMAADLFKLEVSDPTGPFEVTKVHAPRLADLNGKTICEISNAGWEIHRMFPVIRELLQRQFPTVKVIPFTEVIATRRDCENVDLVAKVLKAKGCQAVIAGNAG